MPATLTANGAFMEKRDWRKVVMDPFSGKKFILYLMISWVLLILVKESLQESGIILGALPSTLLLFVIVFLIGLPVSLSNRQNEIAKVVATQGQEVPKTNPPLSKKMRVGILATILLGAIGFWMLHAYQNKEARQLSCLKLIQYKGTSYAIQEEGSTRRFKTQNEAMDYCLKIIERE